MDEEEQEQEAGRGAYQAQLEALSLDKPPAVDLPSATAEALAALGFRTLPSLEDVLQQGVGADDEEEQVAEAVAEDEAGADEEEEERGDDAGAAALREDRPAPAFNDVFDRDIRDEYADLLVPVSWSQPTLEEVLLQRENADHGAAEAVGAPPAAPVVVPAPAAVPSVPTWDPNKCSHFLCLHIFLPLEGVCRSHVLRVPPTHDTRSASDLLAALRAADATAYDAVALWDGWFRVWAWDWAMYRAVCSAATLWKLCVHNTEEVARQHPACITAYTRVPDTPLAFPYMGRNWDAHPHLVAHDTAYFWAAHAASVWTWQDWSEFRVHNQGYVGAATSETDPIPGIMPRKNADALIVSLRLWSATPVSTWATASEAPNISVSLHGELAEGNRDPNDGRDALETAVARLLHAVCRVIEVDSVRVALALSAMRSPDGSVQRWWGETDAPPGPSPDSAAIRDVFLTVTGHPRFAPTGVVRTRTWSTREFELLWRRHSHPVDEQLDWDLLDMWLWQCECRPYQPSTLSVELGNALQTTHHNSPPSWQRSDTWMEALPKKKGSGATEREVWRAAWGAAHRVLESTTGFVLQHFPGREVRLRVAEPPAGTKPTGTPEKKAAPALVTFWRDEPHTLAEVMAATASLHVGLCVANHDTMRIVDDAQKWHGLPTGTLPIGALHSEHLTVVLLLAQEATGLVVRPWVHGAVGHVLWNPAHAGLPYEPQHKLWASLTASGVRERHRRRWVVAVGQHGVPSHMVWEIDIATDLLHFFGADPSVHAAPVSGGGVTLAWTDSQLRLPGCVSNWRMLNTEACSLVVPPTPLAPADADTLAVICGLTLAVAFRGQTNGVGSQIQLRLAPPALSLAGRDLPVSKLLTANVEFEEGAETLRFTIPGLAMAHVGGAGDGATTRATNQRRELANLQTLFWTYIRSLLHTRLSSVSEIADGLEARAAPGVQADAKTSVKTTGRGHRLHAEVGYGRLRTVAETLWSLSLLRLPWLQNPVQPACFVMHGAEPVQRALPTLCTAPRLDFPGRAGAPPMPAINDLCVRWLGQNEATAEAAVQCLPAGRDMGRAVSHMNVDTMAIEERLASVNAGQLRYRFRAFAVSYFLRGYAPQHLTDESQHWVQRHLPSEAPWSRGVRFLTLVVYPHTDGYLVDHDGALAAAKRLLVKGAAKVTEGDVAAAGQPRKRKGKKAADEAAKSLNAWETPLAKPFDWDAYRADFTAAEKASSEGRLQQLEDEAAQLAHDAKLRAALAAALAAEPLPNMNDAAPANPQGGALGQQLNAAMKRATAPRVQRESRPRKAKAQQQQKQQQEQEQEEERERGEEQQEEEEEQQGQGRSESPEVVQSIQTELDAVAAWDEDAVQHLAEKPPMGTREGMLEMDRTTYCPGALDPLNGGTSAAAEPWTAALPLRLGQAGAESPALLLLEAFHTLLMRATLKLDGDGRIGRFLTDWRDVITASQLLSQEDITLRILRTAGVCAGMLREGGRGGRTLYLVIFFLLNMGFHKGSVKAAVASRRTLLPSIVLAPLDSTRWNADEATLDSLQHVIRAARNVAVASAMPELGKAVFGFEVPEPPPAPQIDVDSAALAPLESIAASLEQVEGAVAAFQRAAQEHEANIIEMAQNTVDAVGDAGSYAAPHLPTAYDIWPRRHWLPDDDTENDGAKRGMRLDAVTREWARCGVVVPPGAPTGQHANVPLFGDAWFLWAGARGGLPPREFHEATRLPVVYDALFRAVETRVTELAGRNLHVPSVAQLVASHGAIPCILGLNIGADFALRMWVLGGGTVPAFPLLMDLHAMGIVDCVSLNERLSVEQQPEAMAFWSRLAATATAMRYVMREWRAVADQPQRTHLGTSAVAQSCDAQLRLLVLAQARAWEPSAHAILTAMLSVQNPLLQSIVSREGAQPHRWTVPDFEILRVGLVLRSLAAAPELLEQGMRLPAVAQLVSTTRHQVTALRDMAHVLRSEDEAMVLAPYYEAEESIEVPALQLAHNPVLREAIEALGADPRFRGVVADILHGAIEAVRQLETNGMAWLNEYKVQLQYTRGRRALPAAPAPPPSPPPSKPKDALPPPPPPSKPPPPPRRVAKVVPGQPYALPFAYPDVGFAPVPIKNAGASCYINAAFWLTARVAGLTGCRGELAYADAIDAEFRDTARVFSGAIQRLARIPSSSHPSAADADVAKAGKEYFDFVGRRADDMTVPMARIWPGMDFRERLEYARVQWNYCARCRRVAVGDGSSEYYVNMLVYDGGAQQPLNQHVSDELRNTELQTWRCDRCQPDPKQQPNDKAGTAPLLKRLRRENSQRLTPEAFFSIAKDALLPPVLTLYRRSALRLPDGRLVMVPNPPDWQTFDWKATADVQARPHGTHTLLRKRPRRRFHTVAVGVKHAASVDHGHWSLISWAGNADDTTARWLHLNDDLPPKARVPDPQEDSKREELHVVLLMREENAPARSWRERAAKRPSERSRFTPLLAWTEGQPLSRMFGVTLSFVNADDVTEIQLLRMVAKHAHGGATRNGANPWTVVVCTKARMLCAGTVVRSWPAQDDSSYWFGGDVAKRPFHVSRLVRWSAPGEWSAHSKEELTADGNRTYQYIGVEKGLEAGLVALVLQLLADFPLEHALPSQFFDWRETKGQITPSLLGYALLRQREFETPAHVEDGFPQLAAAAANWVAFAGRLQQQSPRPPPVAREQPKLTAAQGFVPLTQNPNPTELTVYFASSGTPLAKNEALQKLFIEHAAAVGLKLKLSTAAANPARVVILLHQGRSEERVEFGLMHQNLVAAAEAVGAWNVLPVLLRRNEQPATPLGIKHPLPAIFRDYFGERVTDRVRTSRGTEGAAHVRLEYSIPRGGSVVWDTAAENVPSLQRVAAILKSWAAEPVPPPHLITPASPLHNWGCYPFVLDEIQWTTVEHYVQAQKFKTSKPELLRSIQRLDEPESVVAVGEENGAHVRKDWEEVQDDVMLTALRVKFTNHADVRQRLCETAPRVLQYEDVDDYWGVQMTPSDPPRYAGMNRVGRMLMLLRAEFLSAQ